MPTVVVADPIDLLQPYAAERAAAAAVGADFLFSENDESLLSNADVILTAWTKRFPEDLLRRLPRCRLIVRYGVGVDNIDLAAATACGIVVCNAPTYCIEDVADHATALILNTARPIPWLDRQVRVGMWADAPKDDPRVRRLNRLTIGIVGVGKIGRRVARRLAPFGCRILGADPFVSDEELRARGVEPVTLEELLPASDIVTLHVPLQPDTHHLIDPAKLRLMRPTASIVNTSRGGVLDEAALLAALREERIFGAALDVLDPEPPPIDNPLFSFDPRRVILTPHFAAWSAETLPDLHAEVSAAFVALLQGHWPTSAMNPNVTPKAPLKDER